ncbi:cuticle collagen 1-like [Mercenaria mercenaria]|uniref:cuticle collagen 1-like n=1 Tax=Mercenaria mercenaria TaxID=6596 RepID=UPI00234E7749|nr:cuticle collagen 1-like [Mercenaria mercenaria]
MSKPAGPSVQKRRTQTSEVKPVRMEEPSRSLRYNPEAARPSPTDRPICTQSSEGSETTRIDQPIGPPGNPGIAIPYLADPLVRTERAAGQPGRPRGRAEGPVGPAGPRREAGSKEEPAGPSASQGCPSHSPGQRGEAWPTVGNFRRS